MIVVSVQVVSLVQWPPSRNASLANENAISSLEFAKANKGKTAASGQTLFGVKSVTSQKTNWIGSLLLMEVKN